MYIQVQKTDIHTCLFSKGARFVFGHVDIHEKTTKVRNFIDIKVTNK